MQLLRPTTVAEICSALAAYSGEARPHAGGTDLLVRMRAGQLKASCLVDLSGVRELRRIELTPGGRLEIGAMVSLHEAAAFPTVRDRLAALSEALSQVGSVQIRHRGTLVGNVCNASPAADSLPALLLFDTAAHIVGGGGRRQVPLDRFVRGPGETVLGPDEFVESLSIALPPAGAASRFIKLGRRRAVDCSIVSAAVLAARDGDLRAAFGAVAPVPFRDRGLEERLRGRMEEPAALEAACEAVKQTVRPIDDVRASAEYRCEMAAVVFRRALCAAVKRLK